MKTITLTFFLVVSLSCFSQKQDKEIVYLLFDKTNKKKCLIEDGSGNSKYLNKFRKEFEDQGNIINFKICNETFTTHKTKSFKDTCSVKALNNLKIVDLKYINEKKSKSILKYNPFEKIYIIEKISNTKIIKYEVTWIDDWIMIDD